MEIKKQKENDKCDDCVIGIEDKCCFELDLKHESDIPAGRCEVVKFNYCPMCGREL
jgi:hypothetical protein